MIVCVHVARWCLSTSIALETFYSRGLDDFQARHHARNSSDDCWQARVCARTRQGLHLRSPWFGCSCVVLPSVNPSPPWPTAQFGLRSLMACYFTNQVLAQLDGLRLWSETTAHKNDVYLFLVKLDEEVARLHFPAFDTDLNVLSQEQIIQVSRLKAFSRVRTTVSMGQPHAEKHQTFHQRDRPVWLRRLGKLMLCSHEPGAGAACFIGRKTRPTKTIFIS